jgi:hypothetical protein
VPPVARHLDGRAFPHGYLGARFSWTALYAAAAGWALGTAAIRAGSQARDELFTAAALVFGLGGVHAVIGLLHRDRGIPGELVGMTSLASGALLVLAASGRPLDREAFGVMVLALAYFVSTLAIVRAFRRSRVHPGTGAVACLWVHVGIIGVLAAFWSFGSVPAGSLLAFLPVLGRLALAPLFPARNLREVGLREVAVSVAFVLLAGISFLLA